MRGFFVVSRTGVIWKTGLLVLVKNKTLRFTKGFAQVCEKNI